MPLALVIAATALAWGLPNVFPGLRHPLWYVGFFGLNLAAMLVLVDAVLGGVSVGWGGVSIAATLINMLTARVCQDCGRLVLGRGLFDQPLQCRKCGGDLKTLPRSLSASGRHVLRFLLGRRDKP